MDVETTQIYRNKKALMCWIQCFYFSLAYFLPCATGAEKLGIKDSAVITYASSH